MDHKEGGLALLTYSRVCYWPISQLLEGTDAPKRPDSRGFDGGGLCVVPPNSEHGMFRPEGGYRGIKIPQNLPAGRESGCKPDKGPL